MRAEGIRVLVVDDNAFMRMMLETVLGFEGFDVDFAVGGHDGLMAARRSRPDVIVLDIVMPDLDGREVARRLAADTATASIPIVFCSDLSEEGDIWEGWQAGAASYLPKPFDVLELVEELLRVVERSRSIPDAPGDVRLQVG